MKTKFFTYRQNNSYGRFYGPMYVIIEAFDAVQADTIAEGHGLYFFGVAYGRDCSCCGDRWSMAYEGDGNDSPLIYGKKPDPERETYIIHFLNEPPISNV